MVNYMNFKLNVSPSPKDKREIAEVRWERVENMGTINTNRGLRKLDSVFPKIVKLAKKKMNENMPYRKLSFS